MGILMRLSIRACKALCLALVVLLASTAQYHVYADDLRLSEQKIKAGLVYNFLKYTTWPHHVSDDPNLPLEVCLMGDDPFDGYLYPIQGRTAQQRVIDISVIRDYKDLASCHFIFIDDSLQDNVSEILSELEGKPVLVASDIPHFSKMGGMIEFSMKNQRVHIYVNQSSLRNSSLLIEARLLKLTEIVP